MFFWTYFQVWFIKFLSLNLNFGPVHKSSGLNLGSELNHGHTISNSTMLQMTEDITMQDHINLVCELADHLSFIRFLSMARHSTCSFYNNVVVTLKTSSTT